MASNFTSADLQNLDQAIATGALRVRIGDKEIIYQSTEQMLKARELMRRELGLAGTAQRYTPSFSKGL